MTSAIIQRFVVSEKDKETLAKIVYDTKDISDDFFDYSKVIVKKPWGYEYLIFENESVAVWILYLKPGALTSMHCHPQKRTSLVVLEGSVECSSLKGKFERTSGEALMIDQG
ncbi:MAG TPA: hypothetical protein EYO73_06250, partial [Sulfurimonas sp.]|nr:hypothetical protein [Sulfurimonas sp.]